MTTLRYIEGNNMYLLGLDLGSSYTKGVLVDRKNNIVDSHVLKTGFDFNAAARKIIDKLSAKREINYPVFTCGYGREQLDVPYVSNSEIIALARAVYNKYKRKCTIIDIGGQDTKYIQINDLGQVDKFKMNRKCAAGTGSFIEEIAFRLDVPATELNSYISKATEQVKINSFCTVFAISEIIGMIKKGFTLPNVITGIYNSVVERCLEMAPIEDFLIVTGGVPDNHPEIINLFRKRFANTESPEKSQLMAAYGCVLLNART